MVRRSADFPLNEFLDHHEEGKQFKEKVRLLSGPPATREPSGETDSENVPESEKRTQPDSSNDATTPETESPSSGSETSDEKPLSQEPADVNNGAASDGQDKVSAPADSEPEKSADK